jgi:hypothetical protein
MASCVPLPHQTSLLRVVPKPHALQVRPQLTALSRSSAVIKASDLFRIRLRNGPPGTDIVQPGDGESDVEAALKQCR